ncbi:MFS transporter [Desulfobacterota bacterium M19]
MSVQRPGQLYLAVILRFLIYFCHWMILAYMPVFLKGAGFADFDIGLAISLYSLTSMALMLPMGAFSDVFSPRYTLMAGALLFALSFAALSCLATHVMFWPLMGAIGLSGFGVAALIVVSESLFLKIFGQEQRGRRIGMYQFSTYLGFGLGPLAGGYLLSYAPWALFMGAFVISLLIFAVSWALSDCPPIDFSFRQYIYDLKRPKALLLTACVFVLGTHFGVEQTSFSLLLKENLALSSRTIGMVFTCIGLWMALMVPFVGRLHDRHDSIFIFLLAGLGISGLFQAFTALAGGLLSVIVIRILHTMGDTLAMLELSVLVSMFFPAARLGGSAGFMYAVRTTATFAAALGAGLVNRYWGYPASFLINGIFVMVFAVCSLLFILGSGRRRQALGWQTAAFVV